MAMMPPLWILLSIAMTPINAQYGPFRGISVNRWGSSGSNLLLKRRTLPGLPADASSMVGHWMIINGQRVEIVGTFSNPFDERLCSRTNYDRAIFCWTTSPEYTGPFGESTVQFYDEKPLEWKGWGPHKNLETCQGDCDSDNDCESGAICVHNLVPKGCQGINRIGFGKWWKLHIGDYCGSQALNGDVVPVVARPVMDRPLFKIEISPMAAMAILLVAMGVMATIVMVCCRGIAVRKKAAYKVVYSKA